MTLSLICSLMTTTTTASAEAIKEADQILAPTGAHEHTIILLHGRDSSAADFQSDFFESQDSERRYLPQLFPNIRWVFPAAERSPRARAAEIQSEMQPEKQPMLQQWFDMWHSEKPHEHEEEQLYALVVSAHRIAHKVKREAAEVGDMNVILGGISQGCATTIHALLCSKHALEQYAASDQAPNEAISTPVLLEHCKDDEVVDLQYGEELRDRLTNLGMIVEWREYEDGAHWVNEPKGIDDTVNFVSSCWGKGAEDH